MTIFTAGSALQAVDLFERLLVQVGELCQHLVLVGALQEGFKLLLRLLAPYVCRDSHFAKKRRLLLLEC